MANSSRDRQAKELLATLEAREIADCGESFEYFVFKWAKTFDPHDKVNPVKNFPDKEYLRLLAREFQHGPEILYIAKSRQLMVSWLLAARTVWEILYHPHAWAVFQSKKQEDAAEMIYDTVPSKARASFIMAHLPDWMQVCICVEGEKRVTKPFSLDQKTFSYGSIILPNGSRAEALAQGPSQIEGKVPSFLCSDESSLQDEWKASWAAAMPCIAGGGRAIAVATMRLPSAYGEEIAPCDDVDPDGLLRGVAKFVTKRGGDGIRIHYSADPDKDPLTDEGAAWFAGEVAKQEGGFDGADWQQHMEINPQSLAGTRAIPYWDKIAPQVIIPDIPYELASLWTLDSGLDYGARNKTVWQVFANDYEGNRYMVYEIAVPANEVGGIYGFAAMMKQSPFLTRVNGRICADPTIWNKDQNVHGGLVSKAQIFAQAGVRLVPAKTNGQEADEVLLNRLHGAYWAGYDEPDFVPRLFICQGCKETAAGFPKLLYQDHKGVTFDQNSLKEKLVDRRNDWWDAMKYAEVSAPGPTRLAEPKDKPFTFDWLLGLAQRDQNKHRYVRS